MSSTAKKPQFIPTTYFKYGEDFIVLLYGLLNLKFMFDFRPKILLKESVLTGCIAYRFHNPANPFLPAVSDHIVVAVELIIRSPVLIHLLYAGRSIQLDELE